MLGQQGHPPGPLPGGEGGAVLPLNQDLSLTPPEAVSQPPEQRGLSAAVPAQNAHQLPAGHREGDVPDHEIGISGPQAPHLKHRAHRPPPFAATAGRPAPAPPAAR